MERKINTLPEGYGGDLNVAKKNYKRIVFWIHEVDVETIDPIKNKIPLIYVHSLKSLRKTIKKGDLVIVSLFNLVSDSDDLLSLMDNTPDIDFGGYSFYTNSIENRVGREYNYCTTSMGEFVFSFSERKVNPTPNHGIWEPDDLLKIFNTLTFKRLA